MAKAKNDVKLNYIYNAAYQVLMLIAPLITAPYLSRVLEPDGVGTVSYVESIVSYFTLFATMGISIYGQREISYVQDDIKKRTVVFWNTKVLGFCTSIAASVVYVIFALLQKEQSTMYLIRHHVVFSGHGGIWKNCGAQRGRETPADRVFFSVHQDEG